LVILTSGVVPNFGNTCTFSVISSRVRVVQPKVVSSVDPFGSPLLQSDLTATGVSPQTVADIELDFSFSAFRVDQAPLRLTVRFAGRIAVAHLVANNRLGAARLVSLLQLAALDVRHGLTKPRARDDRLTSPTTPQLPRGACPRCAAGRAAQTHNNRASGKTPIST
jgi:hypothetical protein